jgi:hypothetical protein
MIIPLLVTVEVGFEVVWNLLFVPHHSGSWVVECINMIEYHNPLSWLLG